MIRELAADEIEGLVAQTCAEAQEALVTKLEVWQGSVTDSLSTLHERLICELQEEVRGTMQSHAAAIKTLDEQLCLVDEQLLQIDTCLGKRSGEDAYQPCLFAASKSSREPLSTPTFSTITPPADVVVADAPGRQTGSFVPSVRAEGDCTPSSAISFGGPDSPWPRVGDAMGHRSEESSRFGFGRELMANAKALGAQRSLQSKTFGVRAVRKDSHGSVAATSDEKRSDSKLRITIVKATGLKNLNWTGDAPWCKCVLLRDGQLLKDEFCDTKPVRNTLDPVWNETHDLYWSVGDVLQFIVYDQGLIGSKTEGHVTVPSDSFYPNGFEGELPISDLVDAKLHVRIWPQVCSVAESGAASPTPIALPVRCAPKDALDAAERRLAPQPASHGSNVNLRPLSPPTQRDPPAAEGLHSPDVDSY